MPREGITRTTSTDNRCILCGRSFDRPDVECCNSSATYEDGTCTRCDPPRHTRGRQPFGPW